MKSIYDQIGKNYSKTRQTDQRIAEQIYSKLTDAKRILNIGAGTGSYEPKEIELIAVEPSSKMIAQRKADSHQVIQASAEQLPFEEKSFSHSMAVLSMHHWTNRELAFNEIKRVTKDKFVAITWNPSSLPFWVTRDYFPEIFEMDKSIFPKMDELKKHFGEVQISPLMIPEDCEDGFLAAFWKRPEAYLNEGVRQSISTFSKLKDLSKGLHSLERDLKSGAWTDKNKDILNKTSLDAGYVIITASVKQQERSLK